MIGIKCKFTAYLFALYALLASLPAYADFALGLQYYQRGDFEKAFAEFSQAAKMDDMSAQFNLGVMYYNGQYVSADPIKAYAWLALAAQAKEFQDGKVHLQIYQTLSNEQKLDADKLYKELFDQYSSKSVEARLIPTFQNKNGAQGNSHPLKSVYPNYPHSMARGDTSGLVDAFFTIDKHGLTRDHVVYMSTNKAFSDVVIDAIRKWQYEPKVIDGKVSEVHGMKIRFSFFMENERLDEGTVRHLLEKQKLKAESGNAEQQFLYAYYLDLLPRQVESMNLETLDNANLWYHTAARNGSVASSFFLGQNVLNGERCVSNPDQAMGWLLRAAQSGVVDAQYLLAQELLSGSRLQKNEAQGLYWLEMAANIKSSKNDAAKLRYAWVLATHPDPEIRNGQRAAQYFASVHPSYEDRQTYFQTAAAVAAENADFVGAIVHQRHALEDAKYLEIPTDHLRTQLEKYRNNLACREIP